MLDIGCDRCGEGLDVPGALVFSPPDVNGMCVKIHLCGLCHKDFKEWFEDTRWTKPGDMTTTHSQQTTMPFIKPDDTEWRLSEKIRATFKCPKCQGAMKLRKNKTTGDLFAGCSNFPKCRGTRQADGSVGHSNGSGGGFSASDWRAPNDDPRYSVGCHDDNEGHDFYDEDSIPF